MTDTEMAALATAAMATVRIKPEKRSPMTISFCLELLLIKFLRLRKLSESLADCIAVRIVGK